MCNYGATGNLPELHYVFDCASQTCISLETCLISVLIYIGATRPSMKVKHAADADGGAGRPSSANAFNEKWLQCGGKAQVRLGLC